ncbi:MAG: hypothetical protein KHW65_01690 [Clostridiales bacterium]|nr:hypothetical protein [Clostridiales bacterium]
MRERNGLHCCAQAGGLCNDGNLGQIRVQDLSAFFCAGCLSGGRCAGPLRQNVAAQKSRCGMLKVPLLG